METSSGDRKFLVQSPAEDSMMGSQSMERIRGGRRPRPRVAAGCKQTLVHAHDWRSQLTPEMRERAAGLICDFFIKDMRICKGFVILESLVGEFEEKMYHEASSRDDYIRKIGAKLDSLESDSRRGDAYRTSFEVSRCMKKFSRMLL